MISDYTEVTILLIYYMQAGLLKFSSGSRAHVYLQRLQSVQNAIGRLISVVQRHNHITLVFEALHWLQS